MEIPLRGMEYPVSYFLRRQVKLTRRKRQKPPPYNDYNTPFPEGETQ